MAIPIGAAGAVALAALLIASQSPAPVSANPGNFGNPERVVIQGYNGPAQDAHITSDEKYLLFDSHSDTPGAKTELYYAKKIDYKTFTFIGKIRGVEDIGSFQGGPAIDTAGNLYFLSPKSYDQNFMSIWHGTFTDGTVTNLAPVEGISKKQHGWFNMGAGPSRDGRYLFFTDNDAHTSTIVVAMKNADGTFTRLANSGEILKNVNDRSRFPFVYGGGLSSDGLELYFVSPPHIYVARRNSPTEPFGVAEELNTGDGLTEGASLSLDKKHFYYHKVISSSRAEIYVLSRE